MSTTVAAHDPVERVDYHEMFKAGDPIVIRKHPDDEREVMGLITHVSNENIKGVGITENGLLPYDGLYWINDPSYLERPRLREEADIAVFDLAETEKQRKEFVVKQLEQDALLARLIADIAKLKTDLASQKARITQLKAAENRKATTHADG